MDLDELISALTTGRGSDPAIGARIGAALTHRRRPLTVQVAGRAFTGRTTLLGALALLGAVETAAVDSPGVGDPVLDADLVVYVLAGPPNEADRRVLSALSPTNCVVALNKSDAVGSRWSAAVEAAARYSAELRLPVVPVIGVLAARTRSGSVEPEELAELRELAADEPSMLSTELFIAGSEARARLVERWGLFGIDCALSALRAVPELSSAGLMQVLHAASGIDPLHELLHRRYEQIDAVRGGELLDELVRLAARGLADEEGSAAVLVEEYLFSDDAMRMGLRAGLACPAVSHLAAGYPSPSAADASEALARASRWRSLVSSDMPPAARRAAMRVHNGYMRQWERLSSAGL
ncbi:hypothetical protein [Nocardia camponoti]|uniref:GTPase n=1 Tax=Nocardia camponoti TaxID=1616106 RepID=A0A917QJ18_9NOCA|nr:hypothetical protein [Nocardia camponoti]GGK53008.1 hypothetical protein GCM10011591_25940 [Nocardia camponoti]